MFELLLLKTMVMTTVQYFLTHQFKHYVFGAQKNRLRESVLLSTQKHTFCIRNKKIILVKYIYLEACNLEIKARLYNKDLLSGIYTDGLYKSYTYFLLYLTKDS